MATSSNPLIGATSGSVGGVTFSKWKGINVIKSKPTVVANPNSPAQQAQRSAFAFMIAAYRLMVGILVLGFKELAIKKSAFNAFTSVNLRNAFDLTSPPTATFKPENLLISKGTITDTVLTSVSASIAGGTVDFVFPSTNGLPGQSATDRPLMAIFNEDKQEWASAVGTGARSTGAGEVDIPSTWEVADVLHCYLGFTSASGDSASDSKYLEIAAVA